MAISRNFLHLDEYLKYASSLKKSLNEKEAQSILIDFGFPSFPKPKSLHGNWHPSLSKTVPAIKYTNLDMKDLRECITVMPNGLFGFEPHILHYTSGTNSLVSSEEVEFFIWFDEFYEKLMEIRKEVSEKRNYIGERLHNLFKGKKLTMYQISFLNTYFGNPSIFDQYLADIGLCFNCFTSGIPRSGLGITRTHQKIHYAIIHERAKPWSKHKNQQVDYVRVNNSGQYVILDEVTGSVTLSRDKYKNKGHIPLDFYDSEKHLIGKPKCNCEKIN